MKRDLFFKVVLPIWGMDKCSILGISTAEDEFNYYSTLMSLTRSDGKKLFKTLSIVLACRDCIKKDGGKSCSHLDALQPPWKSQRKLRDLKVIYQTLDPELFNRENRGLLDTKKIFIFRHLVPAFQKLPKYVVSTPPDLVFVFVDPSGGGSQSQYALITGIRVSGHLVVSPTLC